MGVILTKVNIYPSKIKRQGGDHLDLEVEKRLHKLMTTHKELKPRSKLIREKIMFCATENSV